MQQKQITVFVNDRWKYLSEGYYIKHYELQIYHL